MRLRVWKLVAVDQTNQQEGGHTRDAVRVYRESDWPNSFDSAVVISTYAGAAPTGYGADEDYWYARSPDHNQLLMVGAPTPVEAERALVPVQNGVWLNDLDFNQFLVTQEPVIVVRRQLFNAALQLVIADLETEDGSGRGDDRPTAAYRFQK
jgi:hypothetical protein